MIWWKPETFEAKKPFLKMRMEIIRAIRCFFDNQDYWEVQTPALQLSPGAEVHLQAFETRYLSPDQQDQKAYYLHTSPEFAMKKLLVAGLPKIYQIVSVFRNEQGSSLHSPEFTMLEWYETGLSYQSLMQQTQKLIQSISQEIKITHFKYKEFQSRIFEDWDYITVLEAFEKYANRVIDPNTHQAEWEELFYTVFLNEIEPQLGQGRPTILYDYPVSMAALARKKPEDERFAERFELYICGMELANGFGELTDPVEQGARLEADMALKQKLYGKSWPVDEDFIAALSHGMPQVSGIALGIDRLVMLATGKEHIKDVLWVPIA